MRSDFNMLLGKNELTLTVHCMSLVTRCGIKIKAYEQKLILPEENKKSFMSLDLAVMLEQYQHQKHKHKSFFFFLKCFLFSTGYSKGKDLRDGEKAV